MITKVSCVYYQYRAIYKNVGNCFQETPNNFLLENVNNTLRQLSEVQKQIKNLTANEAVQVKSVITDGKKQDVDVVWSTYTFNRRGRNLQKK